MQENISSTFNSLQQRSFLLRTEPIKHRKNRLQNLKNWIHANRSAIHQAIYNDFKKPAAEVDGAEIFHVLSEIKLALSKLSTWTTPIKVEAPLTMIGTRSWIKPEPKGVCLIISPWNYPFSLAIGPLISAIAAGNTVILKPSELTPSTSSLLKRLVEEVFTDNTVKLFEGDASVAQALLKLPFDHIFFTGSPAIGKVVMKAAAEHLTSVTLELGGKSPVIVTASASIKEAAKRIVVAKFLNNGQTCVAPDYVLVAREIKDAFVEAIKAELKTCFGLGKELKSSGNYCRIVSAKHFTRLQTLLTEALNKGATIALEGDHDEQDLFFHPHVVLQPRLDSRLMEEEIFGPILPVVEFSSLDNALAIIQEKPKPLALYIFGNQKHEIEKIVNQTSSGATGINDCAVHFLHHNLPFGGVNNSGIGKSHGYFGFLAFSNEKAIMKQRHGLTTFQPFYPPYSALKDKLMHWFLKFF
jgi:aldehyde dehydrogenase (NAD+)